MKGWEDRLTQTVAYIRGKGNRGQRIATAIEDRLRDMNATAKEALSLRLRQGTRWSTSDEDKTTKRHQIRSILLMKELFGVAATRTKATLDAMSNQGVAGVFQSTMLDVQDVLTPPFDTTKPSGRLGQRGLIPLDMELARRVQEFLTRQDRLTDHFLRNLVPSIPDPGTKAVVRTYIERCGNLFWEATEPNRQNALKFAGWGKVLGTAYDQTHMNCWEGVLYAAYQADRMTTAQCTAFYNDYDSERRDRHLLALFGRADPFAQRGVAPGDILVWIEKGFANHVAMYIGLDGETPYVLHNLAFSAAATGIIGLGAIHFETFDNVCNLYVQNGSSATCYMTTPFWERGAPTNAYFRGLGV